MGRPEKPVDPDAGPVQRLAWQLRQLRERAGNPSYRRLARLAHYSASTLAEAAKGDRLASLEVTLAYVEACGGDVNQWRVRWHGASAAEPKGGEGRSEREDERCPYQGLTAFQPEQAEWFFGRVLLIERLVGRVERLPLIGVFGASGSGKSSLLRAGLLGTIAGDRRLAGRWRTMLMTPTEHPVRALSEQLAKLSGDDAEGLLSALESDRATLDITVRATLAGGPDETRALLIVDQFEEVFTLCTDEEERTRFIGALLDAAHGPNRRTTVVLGVRADFLAHIIAHPGLISALADEAQVLVGPMSADDLSEIITGPAARVGMGVEPDLLNTILADAAEQPGSLPLVSHALLETWQHRRGATLTLSAYQATGGVRGAIAQTAERVYAHLPPTYQQAARRIFLRLTALGDGTEDTRRPIARTELDGVADDETIAEVLTQLAEARLIVLGDGTVEVAHEAMIRAWPRLHRWLTDDRANLIIHRRLTDAAFTWQALARDDGALFRGVQLFTARAWAEDHPGELNQLENTFLAASNALNDAEHDRARRQAHLLRRLVVGVSVLLVLALLGGAVALRQREQAREQQLTALADGLSLQSRSMLATDPGLAGLLAVEAHGLHPDAETRGSVLSAAAAEGRHELNVAGPSIYSLAFSPDHSLLASAGGDGSITLWDPAQGSQVAAMKVPAGRGAQVAFSGDGHRLAATAINGLEGTVTLWDVRTHEVTSRFEEKLLRGAMALSADGTRLAVSVGDGDIAQYDLTTGARQIMHGYRRGVSSLTFSPDGALLVSADGKNHPLVWDVITGHRKAELPAEHVYSVAFGSSGRTLAGSADDHGVYLWDISGDRPVPLPALPLQGGFGWTVSAPVGTAIAVGDENGGVTMWDLQRRERLQAYQDRGRTETVAIALSPDGAMLASAGFNGSIVLHDLEHASFGGFHAQVKDVKISPDGSMIATASTDRAVRLWDIHGKLLGTLGGHADQVEAIAFSPDGRLLAAVTRNVTVTIWDVQRGQQVTDPFPGQGIGASTDVAFSPDGTLLAAATLGPYVWDVHDLASPVEITSRYEFRISTSLTFTPDGRRLLAGSVGGYINAWDATTGKPLSRINTHQGAVQDIAITADGALVATAGDSRTVKLWDAGTLTEVAELHGHTAPIQVLAFSRDGHTLASAGDDHAIILWDVPSRTRIASLTGHTARIRGLAFTPDGTLVSGGEDGRIISWSVDPAAATAHICSEAGRRLTREEWAAQLPSLAYRPSCADPANQ